jgi:Fe-S cluster biogenesis protein NfuA/nitrite reductase/ring-hydroxylating ferredoxin subunit
VTSTQEAEESPALDLRSTGDRIEQLLCACDSAGPVARERAEELLRLVVDLYGAGLERLLDIAHDAGALSDELLERLAADELVSGLLAVHGLHPYTVEDRIAQALDDVRPYLGSHGGDVELVDVTEDGVVRLRMLGSCDGCPSSAVTLQLAVEGAITAAAPEVTAVEVAEVPKAASSGLIPLDSLTVRLREPDVGAGSSWEAVASVADLPSGRLLPVSVGGLDIVLARVGAATYAYRDGCPGCGGSLVGSAVERRLGDAVGTAVLTCPGCHQHFDACRAGAGLDDPGLHLDPLPLLERSGAVEVAVPAIAEPSGAPA